jgi:hypothetical protein
VERPGWREVVGIVAACAVLLVVLAKLDHAGYQKAQERARKVLAEQARTAQHHETVHPARTDSLGVGPITLSVAGAWSSGQSVARPAVTTSARATQRRPNGLLVALAALGGLLALAGAVVLRRSR